MFSIVMPTRNRAALLPYALQSALDQTFTDYEIVVSNNFSSDDTEKVIRQVGGERVRYVRTDRVLPMHDSWDFALAQARGEWVLFLCDDDAIYPEALQIIKRTMEAEQTELVVWRTGLYYIDSPYIPPERRGHLVLPHCSGKPIRMSSKSQLEALFKLEFDTNMIPKMLNCCCRHTLIERVKQRLGRLFPPPSPDFSCCAGMLAMTDSYILIERQLMLGGCGSHVPGVSADGKQPTTHVDFVNDLQGLVYDEVPLTQVTSMNGIAESLLKVKTAMPAELSGLTLDRASYFIWCYRDITELANDRLDVSALRKELFAALARESLWVQLKVRTKMLEPRMPLFLRRGTVRRLILRLGILRLLDATVRRGRRKVVGWEGGFPNILEAVRYASRISHDSPKS
jgi:hypothetical protein